MRNVASNMCRQLLRLQHNRGAHQLVCQSQQSILDSLVPQNRAAAFCHKVHRTDQFTLALRLRPFRDGAPLAHRPGHPGIPSCKAQQYRVCLMHALCASTTLSRQWLLRHCCPASAEHQDCSQEQLLHTHQHCKHTHGPARSCAEQKIAVLQPLQLCLKGSITCAQAPAYHKALRTKHCKHHQSLPSCSTQQSKLGSGSLVACTMHQHAHAKILPYSKHALTE